MSCKASNIVKAAGGRPDSRTNGASRHVHAELAGPPAIDDRLCAETLAPPSSATTYPCGFAASGLFRRLIAIASGCTASPRVCTLPAAIQTF